MKIENEYFEINMIPSTDFVLNGVLNKLYVLLEMKGKTIKREEEEKKRDPLDLSLVLDRSGSMEGQKIEFAKKGVEFIIDNLKSSDLVTLVSYDNEIVVEFKGNPAKKRKDFIKKTRRLTPRNTTALYDGLKKGYKELSRDKKRSNKVFLFSDGLANVGITDPKKIQKLAGDIFSKKVSVSAFGIGDDFDENLMSGIAEHGRGDYHYIEDPDQIPIVMQDALEGVVNILAVDLNLTIQGMNGSTVIKAYNYSSPAKIRIPVYREEDVLEILLEVDVIPEKLKDSDEILKFKLDYASSDSPLENQKMESVLTVKTTDDENDILNENKRIMDLLTLEKIKEREDDLNDLLENYEFDKAINLQNELLADLKILESNEDAILDKIQMMKINLIDLKRNKESRNSLRSMKYSHHQKYLSTMGSSSRKGYLQRMISKEGLDDEDDGDLD